MAKDFAFVNEPTAVTIRTIMIEGNKNIQKKEKNHAQLA
jgi:hypothetical protein